MTNDRPSKVLGSLPTTRPHRRSQKRAARPAGNGAEVVKAPASRTSRKPPAASAKAAAKAKPQAAAAKPQRTAAKRPTAATARAAKRRPARQPLRQPPQPRGTPTVRSSPRPSSRPAGTDILGTAVQAAAELAEIGLAVSARAIRGAVSRLPRP